MLRTQLTQHYRIDLPFIGAGMAFISMPPLAAAVSNAGGMGVLGVGLTPPDGLRAMIQTTKSMTDRPFGVDFITLFATDAHIDVCLEEQVPVVVFFWASSEPFISRLQAGGLKVWDAQSPALGTIEMMWRWRRLWLICNTQRPASC